MSASDPFDDDDDFYMDSNALDEIAQVEAQAISASQMPAPRVRVGSGSRAGPGPSSSSSYHHQISAPAPASRAVSASAAPAPFGRTKSGKPRDPPPLNTAPGVTGGGFGWEHGGKRSVDGNVQRHLDAIDQRQAYWSHGNRPVSAGEAAGPGGGEGNGNGKGNGNGMDIDGEDDYPEVTVDATGRYGMASIAEQADIRGSEAEDQVLDSHNASESLMAQQAQAQVQRRGPLPRAASEEARAARRAAMLGNPNPSANATTNANANSSTSSNGPPIIAPIPRPGPSRPFARSVSTGTNLFSRPQPIAGPSRLSPIIDQPSSQTSSQNSGTMLRRTYLELEDEKRKTTELEKKIAALEEQMQAQAQRAQHQTQQQQQQQQQSTQHWASNLPVDVGDGSKEAMLDMMRKLQADFYTAKGAEATIRRAQKEEHDRHLREKERMAQQYADLQAQLVQKDKDLIAKMDAVRTQAVFNNHAVQSSVAKSRPGFGYTASSQRPRDLRTPHQGSPSRRGNEDARPLITSSKGKGRAPAPVFAPPQPAFRGFTNAFETPGPASARAKSVKAEGRSPTASPTKGSQGYATVNGHGHGHGHGHGQAYQGEDESMQPYDHAIDAGLKTPGLSQRKLSSDGGAIVQVRQVEEGEEDGEVEGDVDVEGAESPRDLKAAFVYHILNHHSLSPFDPASHSSRHTTLRRIVGYTRPRRPDYCETLDMGEGQIVNVNIDDQDRMMWNEIASDLLVSLGDPEADYEQTVGGVARYLERMVEWLLRVIMRDGKVEECDVGIILDIFSLMSLLARLFPLLAEEVMQQSEQGRPGGTWAILAIELYTDKAVREQLRGMFRDKDSKGSGAETVPTSPVGSKSTNAAVSVSVSGPVPSRRRARGRDTGARAQAQAGEINHGLNEADQPDMWLHELGCAIADLGEALCMHARGDGLVDSIVEVIMILTEQGQPPCVIRRGCEMFRAAATFSSHFRHLTTFRDERQSLVDRFARYLTSTNRKGSSEEILATGIAIIRGLSMLTVADPGAIVLIAEKSILIPCLIQVLEREVRKVWGINAVGESVIDAALIIYPTLTLLHMLVFPPPFSRSSASHYDAYHIPSYPSSRMTIRSDDIRPSSRAGRSGNMTILRPSLEVEAERQSFFIIQDRLLSELPDPEGAQIQLGPIANAGAESLAAAGGGRGGGGSDGIPLAIRLADKLREWSAVKEWAGVRHLFISAVMQVAYDEIVDDDFAVLGVGSMWEDEERDKARKWGLKVEDVLEDLRFAQILAQDLLDAVFEGPEADDLYLLYSQGMDADADADADPDADAQAAAEAGAESDGGVEEIPAPPTSSAAARRAINGDPNGRLLNGLSGRTNGNGSGASQRQGAKQSGGGMGTRQSQRLNDGRQAAKGAKLSRADEMEGVDMDVDEDVYAQVVGAQESDSDIEYLGQ